jgi:protein-L-isoaspartate(D-aspartate) O-methyltransferase
MSDYGNKIRVQKCKNLADEISKIYPISSDVYRAICQIDREQFVPKGFSRHAYSLDALPMAADQWISSPLTVAKMSEALTCRGADSILEIGCGSGYQASILSRLVRRVFTIERVGRLLESAKERFKILNIHNIHTRHDDGQNGWREYAPYDRILLSASTPEIPKELFNQLSDGGILVAPIEKNGSQIIMQFTKERDTIKEAVIDKCLFVPIKNGKDF